MTDGGTVPANAAYGDIKIGAYDANVGTSDGDGVRLVVLDVTDTETGREFEAGREGQSTYDFGARLQAGKTYTLTAWAKNSSSTVWDDGWSETSITVTAR